MQSFFCICWKKFNKTLSNQQYLTLKNMISLENAEFFMHMLKKLYNSLSNHYYKTLKNIIE